MRTIIRAAMLASVFPLSAAAQEIAPDTGFQPDHGGLLPGVIEVQPNLGDIRNELTAIGILLEDLRAEMRPTGATAVAPPADASLLARLDSLEARLRGATGQMERISFEIRKIADDGGLRLSDLDFRVTMLEGGDPSFVPPTTALGGTGLPGAQPNASGAAVSEQLEFDAAKTAFETQNFGAAARLFQAHLDNYPGGPLSTDARYYLAESQFAQDRFHEAANNYLTLFTGDAAGPRAHAVLFNLGKSLAGLGQIAEACLTMAEALNRFGFSQGQEYLQMVSAERSLYQCE